ncbi:hypothetical protein HQ459_07455 [bacterium]|nr:hypothetical protein [bacterium]
MKKAKQSPMLVNTADAADGIITPITYARTKDGKINLAAYKNKKGQIKENNLTINVKILESRVRYGHLDLKVTPLNGEGEVWVERKNILIESDPADTQMRTQYAKSRRALASQYQHQQGSEFEMGNVLGESKFSLEKELVKMMGLYLQMPDVDDKSKIEVLAMKAAIEDGASA